MTTEQPALPALSNTQIHLRIPNSLIRPFCSESTPPVDDPSSLPGHLYLLAGELHDIVRYAGNTAEWLINVSRLLCEPLLDGLLLTHVNQNVEYWYGRAKTPSWIPVDPADPLHPGIYEFCPVQQNVILSQISARRQHSKTSSNAQDTSTKFKSDLVERDVHCVITQATDTIASHLVPKRMGDDRSKELVERFCGAEAADGIHRFHPQMGILLFTSLDHLLDRFRMGFYHIGGSTYEVHSFHADPNLTIAGLPPIPATYMPPLHRHPVTFAQQAVSAALPPPGIFFWHYLQCVILRFGTLEFKSHDGVYHFELPFQTSDDEEDWGDDEEDPPWPSYHLDMAMAKETEKVRLIESRNSVQKWASDVS